MTQQDHYDPRIDLEAMEDLPNYYRAMMNYFDPYLGGEGIEFGAGWGTVAGMMEPHFDRLDLVEPANNLAERLKTRFKHSTKVTVITETLEMLSHELPERSRDVIILVNVLEHIENDGEAIKSFFRILRPGGHLLLFVPALACLFSKLDTALGHYRRYHLKDLRAQVEGVGFTTTVARYFDLFGVIPWWLINTLAGKTRLDPRMVRIYDSWIVPATGTLERILKPPLGKNILLVAQRPGSELP
ncbi:MAG: class I SAM-dependent methyltransferase [Rhodospirillales bacterium]|nr:class I SAM-dependent methyltransferase [Rhodospirillales bacterium]